MRASPRPPPPLPSPQVKLLRAPKFDAGKLMEVHGDYTAEAAAAAAASEKVERPDEEVVGMATEEAA